MPLQTQSKVMWVMLPPHRREKQQFLLQLLLLLLCGALRQGHGIIEVPQVDSTAASLSAEDTAPELDDVAAVEEVAQELPQVGREFEGEAAETSVALLDGDAPLSVPTEAMLSLALGKAKVLRDGNEIVLEDSKVVELQEGVGETGDYQGQPSQTAEAHHSKWTEVPLSETTLMSPLNQEGALSVDPGGLDHKVCKQQLNASVASAILPRRNQHRVPCSVLCGPGSHAEGCVCLLVAGGDCTGDTVG